MTGRRLIDAPPSEWVGLHRQRWPDDCAPVEAAVGRLLSRVLVGEQVVMWKEGDPGVPVVLKLDGISAEDRVCLEYFVPPVPQDDGSAPTKGLQLSWVLLPWALRQNETWTMHLLPDSVYTRLGNVDAMVCALILIPIMRDLAVVFALRSGQEDRAERLVRCREGH